MALTATGFANHMDDVCGDSPGAYQSMCPWWKRRIPNACQDATPEAPSPLGLQVLALCHKQCGCCNKTYPAHPIEHAALRDLFLSLDGDHWRHNFNQGWMTDMPHCWWTGIGCDDEGHVVSIMLNDVGLFGSMPTSISNLTQLRYLGMAGNRLVGTLPQTIGYLSKLYVVALSQNSMTGQLPSSLGQLSKVTELILNDNLFVGTIPRSFGYLHSVRTLGLWNTNLHGTVPPELGDCELLENLALQKNRSQPSRVRDLSSHCYGVSLTGSLPAELGKLENLQQFSVGNNTLVRI